jgi:hypothetical protein
MSKKMKLPTFLSRSLGTVVRSRLPGFDPLYYQYWYRDVLDYPGSPLAHYLQIGWKEGRDPSAGFSTVGYLNANPDVKNAGKNPLVHFLDNGLAEGRKGWQKDIGAPPPLPTSVELPPKLLSGPRAER